jgi:hypothetical protein
VCIGLVLLFIFLSYFVARTCVLSAPVRPILHQSSCSNKTVQNALKHEVDVRWGGSGAFVAKNSDATSLDKLVH